MFKTPFDMLHETRNRLFELTRSADDVDRDELIDLLLDIDIYIVQEDKRLFNKDNGHRSLKNLLEGKYGNT